MTRCTGKHRLSDWGELLQAFRDGRGRPVLLDRKRAGAIAAQECPTEVRAVLAEAEGLLAGERAYFGYPSVNVGSAVDWNLRPDQPTIAGQPPRAAIDHRAHRRYPKWIWELNRLQHLPVLAAGVAVHRRRTIRRGAFDHLDSWLDQNPSGTGSRGAARSRRAFARSRWPCIAGFAGNSAAVDHAAVSSRGHDARRECTLLLVRAVPDSVRRTTT